MHILRINKCTYIFIYDVMYPSLEQVDDSLKVEVVEIYYDPAELFGGLLKGKSISELESLSCPFSKLTTK